jgi:tetratricopeptide (TPR) repeat protein
MAYDVELAQRHPGTAEFSHMHVSRLQAAGDIARRFADNRQALHDYEQALDLLSAIVKEDPANSGAQMRRAFAYNGAGFALTNLHDLPAASRTFQKALDLLLPQVNPAPTNEDALYGAADAYAGLAEIEALQARSAAGIHDRAAHWRQALSWSDLGLKCWRQVKEPGLVGPYGFDCVPLPIVTARRAQYAAMLGAVNGKAAIAPPPPSRQPQNAAIP